MSAIIGDGDRPIDEDWNVESTECQMKSPRFFLKTVESQ